MKFRKDRDVREELESHIQLEIEENIGRGMSASDARQAAYCKFGNPTLIREEVYRMGILGLLDSLTRDFRAAIRSLTRSASFTTIAVITLALGIGATTAIFTVVNGVLIKPLPYPDPDALVGVWHSAAFGGTTSRNANHAASMYVTYLDNNQTFQEFGVWNNGSSTITGAGDPQQVRTFRVTYGVLRAFAVPPQLGRWFSEADDSPASSETILLMHGYWQRRFGGDPAILGRTIIVDSRPREVIGVMPQSFQLNSNPEVILPLRFDRAQLPSTFAYVGLARLKPGVSLAQANADMERMIPIWIDRFKMQRFANLKLGPAIRSFKEDVVGDVSNVLWVLMGTIGVVLLVACANVANLILVRTHGRQQELAIRAALGAARARIARELLLESLAFGIAGGFAGLALAYGAMAVLRSIAPTDLPRLAEITIDPSVLLFTLAISIASGVFFGAIPIFKFAGPRLATMLHGAGRASTETRERHRSQGALVVTQVALAMVLLVGSGLMVRSFQALRRVNPGFTQPERIETLRIVIPPAQVPVPEAVTQMQKAIVEKIAAIPGVDSAALVSGLPMEANEQSGSPVSVEGQPDDGGLPPVRRIKFVSPGVFQTLGTRLVAGRDFTWTDIFNKTESAVVSENFAKLYWGDAHSALGKRIREGIGAGPWQEVIGVVGDVYDDGASRPPTFIVYWPARTQTASMGQQHYVPRSMAFAIRSGRTGTESLLKQLQEAVWSVNADLPLAQVQTLGDIYRQSSAQTSFTLVMLAIAGAMALTLAVIGIYGVLSYALSRRSREIGIRLALGAQHAQLKRMFLRHGLLLATLGVIIGLPAAAAVTKLLSSLLFETGRLDPITYIAVPLLLWIAAALASYMPACRAAAIDPAVALKSE